MAQMFSRNLSVSSIAQAVLAEFLGKKYLKPHIESLQKRFAENSRFLHDLVQNAFPAGTRHHLPPGGFIHWIELPDGIDKHNLIANVADQGCNVSASSIFYPDGRLSQSIRICLGRLLTTEVIQALTTLARCAKTQQTAERPTPEAREQACRSDRSIEMTRQNLHSSAAKT